MEDRRNISEATISMTSASENFESDGIVNATDLEEDTADMGLTLSKDDDEKNIIEDEAGQKDDSPHQDHQDHHDFHHHQDLAHLDDEHEGPLTWRDKLKDFLHTQKFHIAVIILVVLDCVFVIGELVLDYEALAEAKNCAPEEEPASGNTTSDHAGPTQSTRHRREAEGEEPTHAESPTAKAAEALHYLSLIILSIFMIELLLKLIALGRKFFHSKLEVFDAVVIIISFILDIITLVFPENFAVVDLIVVLRLWRILRIVNGVILSVEQRAEKKIHHYKKLKRRAVHVALLFDDYSNALEDEIKVLRELLEKKGVKIDGDLFKDKPSRPHFDRKFHMEDENGHHHHHDNHHGDNHHHADHTGSNVASTSHHHLDTSQPPDYDSIHHGNLEASC